MISIENLIKPLRKRNKPNDLQLCLVVGMGGEDHMWRIGGTWCIFRVAMYKYIHSIYIYIYICLS